MLLDDADLGAAVAASLALAPDATAEDFAAAVAKLDRRGAVAALRLAAELIAETLSPAGGDCTPPAGEPTPEPEGAPVP